MKPEKIIGMVCYLRTGIIDTVEITQQMLTEWVIKYQVQMGSSIYRIGDHCQYCPRKYECEAVAVLRKNSIAAFGSNLPDTHEKLAELYPQSQALADVLAGYNRALRAVIAQHPDGLPIGDGKRLFLETVTKQTITGEAVDTISGIYGWRTSVTIGKTKLMDLVRIGAEKGKKKEACDNLMKELEDAGCVETTEYQKLQERKE